MGHPTMQENDTAKLTPTVTAITISAILKDFPTVNVVFPMFVLCLFMMHVVQS